MLTRKKIKYLLILSVFILTAMYGITNATYYNAGVLSAVSVIPDPIKLGYSATLNYTISEASNVTINVYSETGDLIKTLLNNGTKTSGSYTQTWDGKNSSGTLVPDGRYRFFIEAKNTAGDINGQVETFVIAARSPAISNATDDKDPINPKTGETSTINYTLSSDALVTVAIYKDNTAIRTIIRNTAQTAGVNSVIWDGKDDAGNMVSDGTYTYQIDAVSPTVSTFIYTFKSTITTEKDVPQITDLMVSPDPLKIASNSLNINYNLSETAKVTLFIYDSTNNLIQTVLNNSTKAAGANYSTWNGKDSNGNYVAEGTYKVVIKATDNFNNASIDYTKNFTTGYQPVITDTNDTPDPFNPNVEQAVVNYTLSKNALVTVTIFNGSTPLRTIINNEPKIAGPNSFVWDGKDSTGKLVSDAAYTYQIDAVSPLVSSFISTYKSTITTEKDTPQITNLSVNPDPLKIASATLNINYTLSESAKVTLKILDSYGNLVQTVLNSSSKTAGDNSATWNGKDVNGNFVNEGFYTVEVSAIDNANKASIIYTKNFTIGYQPGISSVTDAPDPFNPLEGVSTFNYTLSKDAIVTVTILSGSNPVKTIFLNELKTAGLNSFTWDGKNEAGNYVGDATYTYQIEAIDPLRLYTSSYTSSVTVEKEAPQITALSVNPNPLKIAGSSLNINFNLSENAKVTIKILDSQGNLVNTVINGSSKTAGLNSVIWNGKDANGNFIPEGSYTVSVSAVDNANKASLEKTVPFTAGNQPAVINVSDTPDPFNPLTNELSTVSYTLSKDAKVTIAIYKDSLLIKSIVTNQTLSAGPYTFTWDGKDASGNYVGDSSYTYQIDTTSPTVNDFVSTFKGTTTLEKANPQVTDLSVNPDPLKIGSSSLNINYTLSENAKVTIKIVDVNGHLVQTVLNGSSKLVGLNTSIWNGKDANGTFVPEGEYKVIVNAVDNFNKASTEVSKTLKAGFLPTISGVSVLKTPFDPSVGEQGIVNYTISKDALVSVTILKDGQIVRNVSTNQLKLAGNNEFIWDGKNNSGAVVTDGNYNYQIDAASPGVPSFISSISGTINLDANSPNVGNLLLNPTIVKIGQNTQINYTINEPATIKIEILNSQNQIIKDIGPTMRNFEGSYNEIWNTLDNLGIAIKAGDYKLRLTATDKLNKATVKEVLFKAGGIPVISNLTVNPTAADVGNNIPANISYSVSEKSLINVSIYDSNNQLWSTVVSNKIVETNDAVSWNGTNNKDEKVPGTYTVKIDAFSFIGNFPGQQVTGTVKVINVPYTQRYSCTDCHNNYPTSHPMSNCSKCHSDTEPSPIQNCASCHTEFVRHTSGSVLAKYSCTYCHNETYSYKIPFHPSDIDGLHKTTADMTSCGTCHQSSLTIEHTNRTNPATGKLYDCNICHQSTNPTVTTAIKDGNTNCLTCHSQAGHTQFHNSNLGPECYTCHNANISLEHGNRNLTCDTCHKSTKPAVVNAIQWGTRECSNCHTTGHGLSFTQQVPTTIPKFAPTGVTLQWMNPIALDYWSDESWVPSDVASGNLTMTKRTTSLNATDVYTFYSTKMSELGWTKVSGPDTAGSKFELVYSKGTKKTYIRCYNTERINTQTTIGSGYRIEILYK